MTHQRVQVACDADVGAHRQQAVAAVELPGGSPCTTERLSGLCRTPVAEPWQA